MPCIALCYEWSIITFTSSYYFPKLVLESLIFRVQYLVFLMLDKVLNALKTRIMSGCTASEGIVR